MTGPADDWSELRQTWQSRPESDALELAQVQAAIARARRRSTVRTMLDAGACALGLTLGAWSLLSGTATGIVVGLAALGFTAFGTGIAWRNARRRRSPVTGTVAEALDAAIALERSAEQWARAIVPMAAAAAAFLAVVVLAAAWDPDAEAAQLRRRMEIVGIGLLVLAVAIGTEHWLAHRARLRRQVLERRRRELEA
jgi:hypothetical protein